MAHTNSDHSSPSPLPTAVWEKIYKLLHKNDLDRIQLTSKDHLHGVEDFVNSSVDAHRSNHSLPKMVLMKHAGTTVYVPLWREQLEVKTTGETISKQKALYPRIVYRHILLQREMLSFNQVSPGVEMKQNNTIMTMCGDGASLSCGFGASKRCMVPGGCYTITATFEYEHSHPRTKFGIVRPTCHHTRLGLGVTESPWILESYPQEWKDESKINAVLYEEMTNKVNVISGTGCYFNSDEQTVDDGATEVLRSKCVSCGGRKRLVNAYFELDLSDKSDGKLSLLSPCYVSGDLATRRYHKHQLASGLEGEFVWAGAIGVYYKTKTSVHIYDSGKPVNLTDYAFCEKCLWSNNQGGSPRI